MFGGLLNAAAEVREVLLDVTNVLFPNVVVLVIEAVCVLLFEVEELENCDLKVLSCAFVKPIPDATTSPIAMLDFDELELNDWEDDELELDRGSSVVVLSSCVLDLSSKYEIPGRPAVEVMFVVLGSRFHQLPI